MGKLSGRIAIITGAGSGLGQATALTFANEGATIVVAELREEAAASTVAKIEEGGGKAKAIIGDISNVDYVKKLIDETITEFGQIDILVNNAGVPMSFTPIEEVTEEQWDLQLNVNAKAAFLTSKYAIPHMKKKGKGSIVNISSIASKRVRPGLTAYCAAKGAIVLLTQALAIEVANQGIRVNAINPGPAETPMLEKFFASMDPVEGRKLFENSVPIGRLCEPEDIANMSLYLCSDEASFITGAVYDVDGGRGL
ncbi:SDR family oxidoreductase [Alkalihalobacillus oceani]|uniref:SDR family NAD(P)-dependent oxidoreductase n=1 Tax=Halalkalibacter oceani TaxID=1653776 RepID=UPI0020425057|nr:SDR family oxidoreductase [Halalkalibacter oceani]MCM3762088.1 SDR family oxidoreductase [Halalkalibacter oceani]